MELNKLYYKESPIGYKMYILPIRFVDDEGGAAICCIYNTESEEVNLNEFIGRYTADKSVQNEDEIELVMNKFIEAARDQRKQAEENLNHLVFLYFGKQKTV